MTAFAPLAGVLAWSALHRDGRPATAPVVTRPTSPAATAPLPATTRPRTEAVVQAEMAAYARQLSAAVGDPAALSDPARRAAVATRAVPLLHGLIADLDEQARLRPAFRPQAEATKGQFRSLLAALDDPTATAELAAQAADPNPATAAAGRAGQLLARWVQAGKDAGRQAAVADEVVSLAVARPNDATVAQLALGCSRTSVDPVLAARLRGAVERRPTTR